MMATRDLNEILAGVRDDVNDELAWRALADWAEENGNGELTAHARQEHLRPAAARAAFTLAAPTGQGRAQCDGVQLHAGYAEPGYSDPASGIVATGNWNDVTRRGAEWLETIDSTPRRLGDVLEALGCACEWEDEWCACDSCGLLVRTEPDGMSWTPSFHVGDGEILCAECHAEDAPPACEECGEELEPDCWGSPRCHDCHPCPGCSDQ